MTEKIAFKKNFFGNRFSKTSSICTSTVKRNKTYPYTQAFEKSIVVIRVVEQPSMKVVTVKFGGLKGSEWWAIGHTIKFSLTGLVFLHDQQKDHQQGLS